MMSGTHRPWPEMMSVSDARHLADDGANPSRHDLTQRPLMACLVLRACTKTTSRGILELLAVSPRSRPPD
jgi:hypothetical protein